ncbi:hypothetical protein UlMin_018838 [Ulmus minor]
MKLLPVISYRNLKFVNFHLFRKEEEKKNLQLPKKKFKNSFFIYFGQMGWALDDEDGKRENMKVFWEFLKKLAISGVSFLYFLKRKVLYVFLVKCRSVKEKRFLHDIVANDRTGIDVDKFDYIVCDSCACGLGCSFQFERLMEIMRVMGDQICYRLFATRADLYQIVYTHTKVKAIKLMVVDALLKANDSLKIVSKTQQPDAFWKLDDTILKTIETSTEKELSEARNLILHIRRRDLFQFCNEFSVPKERLDYFKNITPQDIICSQVQNILQENVAVINAKIDLTRGRNNPLQMYLKMISSSVP